jgi:hypothetical protein
MTWTSQACVESAPLPLDGRVSRRSLSSHIRDLGSTNLGILHLTAYRFKTICIGVTYQGAEVSTILVLYLTAGLKRVRPVAEGMLRDEPTGCRLWSLFLRELFPWPTQVMKLAYHR